MTRRIETEADFWALVERSEPESCWTWRGHFFPVGYGVVIFRGKTWGAHRLAYTLSTGPIPPGQGYHGTVVMHSCDNRACVNPAHLSLGTNADNLRDMAKKGRARQGENRTENQAGYKKITEAQVEAILRDPRGPSAIARSGEYPIGENSIWRIKTGRGWRWVAPELERRA